jgi:hypothetical protein
MTDHRPLLSVRGFNPRLAGRRYPQRAWNSRLQRCQMAEQLSARNARISAVSPRISRWSAQRLPMHCAFTRREIVRTVRKPQSTRQVCRPFPPKWRFMWKLSSASAGLFFLAPLYRFSIESSEPAYASIQIPSLGQYGLNQNFRVKSCPGFWGR